MMSVHFLFFVVVVVVVVVFMFFEHLRLSYTLFPSCIFLSCIPSCIFLLNEGELIQQVCLKKYTEN